jgi:3',5'-cyclic AMP phosphodiesterase CpdA
MRTIAHLSDLHFGKEDPAVVAALLEELAARRPSVVAVSGDLTQRARRAQFAAARAFLDAIDAPKVVVPGNHDVPLYDVLRRAMSPLGRYRRTITSDLSPEYADEELHVAGVNTARSLTWKEGRISVEQIEALRATFCDDTGRLRVLVAHHPLSPPAERPRHRLAGRSGRALRALEGCGLDLVLTGHLHRLAHGELEHPVERLARSVLAFHAGSSTSVRLRGEPNSYNWIEVDGSRLALEIRSWAGRGFGTVQERRFVRGPDGWRAMDGVPVEADVPAEAALGHSP